MISQKIAKKNFWGTWAFFTKVGGDLMPKINVTLLSQIRGWIFSCKTMSLEKAVFFEKTAKKRFEGAVDHFLGKGGVLPKKLI